MESTENEDELNGGNSSPSHNGPICNPAMPDHLIQDIEKMKGDAIGDTLYSERWVLKTLMKITQFTDEEWSDDFETEMCSLWDMTLEKDVVDFLMKQNIFEIISDAIKLSENTRFVEILVGILGNMCCVRSVRMDLLASNDMISLLLGLFDKPDPQTLIQLTRLLNCVAWDLVKESGQTAVWLESELSNSHLTSHLFFILNSSTNEELLISVLELLNTLCGLESCDKDFSQYFCSPVMIEGMIECWKELFGKWTPDEDFPSKQLAKTAAHWTNVLNAFTCHEAGRTILSHYSSQLGAILKSIIQRPDDCIDDILLSAVQILDTIGVDYFEEEVFKRLLHLLNIVYQCVDGTVQTEKDEENLDILLLHSIENCCVTIGARIPHEVMHEVLSRCPENHVLLYWKSVNDKQKDDEPGERAL